MPFIFIWKFLFDHYKLVEYILALQFSSIIVCRFSWLKCFWKFRFTKCTCTLSVLAFSIQKTMVLFNVILFLGMFNGNTFHSLVPLFLMYHGKQIQLKHFLISVIVLIIPYVCLRLYIHPQGGQHFFWFHSTKFSISRKSENRFALKSLLRLSVLLGPLLILAWIK